MKRLYLKLFTLGAMNIVLFTCGAPLKKADDVEPIFSLSEPLGMKVSNLCNILSANKEAPNLQNVDLGLEACTMAGLQAQSFNITQPIQFSAIRSDGQKFSSSSGGVANKEDALLRLQTRSEIWLGRSILNLVAKILPALNDKSRGLFSQGRINNTGGPANFKIELLGEPEFDAQTFKFSVSVYVETLRQQNGNFDVRNKFRVDGQMFDKKYVAATITTTEDADVKVSFIHRGKILLLLVPHAQDIYLDISVDLTFHSFGVDEAIKTEFQKILGEGLKEIIKQISSVEGMP